MLPDSLLEIKQLAKWFMRSALVRTTRIKQNIFFFLYSRHFTQFNKTVVIHSFF